MMFRPATDRRVRAISSASSIPNSMMNPGVIVDAASARLASASSARTIGRAKSRRISTSAAEGGLAGAALKCVGIGKCRKTEAGTMCPSYMATREEIHSTRGRARISVRGADHRSAARRFRRSCASRMRSTCACRAKDARPSARRRWIWRRTARNFSRTTIGAHPPSARRARSSADSTKSRGSRRSRRRLANCVRACAGAGRRSRRKRSRFIRSASCRALRARTFRSWFERRTAASASMREVVLFPDTFNNFFEPQVAIAAVEVLERAGFRVDHSALRAMLRAPALRPGDAGSRKGASERGDGSAGSFRRRRHPDRRAGAELYPDVSRRVAVAVPRRRARDSARVERISARRVSRARSAGLRAARAARARTIVQGHCHQKAIAGMIGDEVALLSRAAGAETRSARRGMLRDGGRIRLRRAIISKYRSTIGERVLIPAIDKAPPDAIIVADGFSCRSQIRHFCPSRRRCIWRKC